MTPSLKYSRSPAVARVTVDYARQGVARRHIADTDNGDIDLPVENFVGYRVTVRITLVGSPDDLLQDYIGTVHGWETYGQPRRRSGKLPPTAADLERIANRACAVSVVLNDGTYAKLPPSRLGSLMLQYDRSMVKHDRPEMGRLDIVGCRVTNVTVRPAAAGVCSVWAYFDHKPPRELFVGESVELAAVAHKVTNEPTVIVYATENGWRVVQTSSGEIIANYPRSAFTRRKRLIKVAGVLYRVTFEDALNA